MSWGDEEDVEPAPVGEAVFAALKEQSPFLRPLDLSRTLALTGIAEVDGIPVATVFHRETEETVVVTAEDHPRGWRLVGIEGETSDLETVAARIEIPGGEIVSIRFDQGQLSPGPASPRLLPRMSPEEARQVAEETKNFRQGISGDGYRGRPPPELVEKMSRLSEEQRGVIIYRVREMRRQGASSELRRQAIDRLVDRALTQTR